jgi:hypothetical protein
MDIMKLISTSAVLAAGGLALLFTATPVTFDLDQGGFAVKSADARVFKGGSSQRVGSVNPADPGPITVPVPKTSGGGGGGSSGGGSGSGKTK